MAGSKRGGRAELITEGEGQHGSGHSSGVSRSGFSKNLTTDELTYAVVKQQEFATKGKKGSSKSPSSNAGNRARIVKGGI